MINLEPRQMKILLLMVSVLSMGILTFVLFTQYLPATEQRDRLTSEIQQENQLIDALMKRSQEKGEAVTSSTFMLQKRIPVEPMIESFILNIERAEVMSNSIVSSISIAEGSDFAPDVQQASTEEGTEENAQTNSAIPAGMKKLTLTLNVESPNYEALQLFVRTLEEQERITKVDTISFTGQGEVTNQTTEVKNKMTYSLTISTFYLPVLEDLQDHLPQLEVPKGSNKTNPFLEGVGN